ncbi:MAG: biopolymer transporter ExbD [Myxococcales bacterium FL481]|nr:MAG: biopolymer transporter ExbD [Myxococcales bacterium FL481]
MAGSADFDEDGINAINITPMVDIMLVLLVIFMVTTTTIQNLEGMQVDKPEAKTGQDMGEQAKSILIVCHPDGRVVVDGEDLPNDGAIVKAIKAKVKQNADVQGLLQCDETAKVGEMVHLMDLMRENGIKRYAIVTEKPKPEDG